MNFEAKLTEKEKIISEFIAWGASKKEIADKLNVSVRTVENHSRNIFEKINIQKSTELSVYWFCMNYNVSVQNAPYFITTTKMETHFIMEISIMHNHFIEVKFSKVVKPYTNTVTDVRGSKSWKRIIYA